MMTTTAALLLSSLMTMTGEPAAAPATKRYTEATESVARDEAVADGRSPWRVSVSARGEHTFNSGLDGGGDVAVTRAGGGLDVGYTLDDRWQLTFSAGPEFSWYSFDEDSFGNDRLDTYQVDLSPGVSVKLSDDWSLRGALLASVSAEFGAGGQAWTLGGLVAARYQLNPKLAMTAGVLVTSRLEDPVLVLPVMGMEWQITEKVRLVTRELGLALSADVSESVTVTLSGGYESRAFRLKDQGPIPEPVLRDRRIPIAVELAWRPGGGVEVFARGGAVVWQQYKIDNDEGREVSKVDGDPAGFVGGGVRVRF